MVHGLCYTAGVGNPGALGWEEPVYPDALPSTRGCVGTRVQGAHVVRVNGVPWVYAAVALPESLGPPASVPGCGGGCPRHHSIPSVAHF